MDLKKSDIRVIRELVTGSKKSREMANSLKLSQARVSVIISSLTKKGFVEKKRGKYSLSNAPHVGAIKLLIQKHPAISVERVLTKTEYKILSSLHGNQKSIKDIAKQIGVTERTVYYKLDVFKTMGLVREIRDGIYALNKDHGAWPDLSRLLSGEIMQTLPIYLDDKNSWYAWIGKQEYIIKTTNPDILLPYLKNEGYLWKYTTTSALRAYGIDLTPKELSLYVYQIPDKIKSDLGDYVSVEDAIIHLFLEKHKKAGEYAKSLIQLNEEKINQYFLEENARKHGVHKEVKNILYELKPVLNIVRYNKDRLQMLFDRLESDEDIEFSIATDLDNYWKWIEAFGRGENLDREKEIIEVISYASELKPPLFKPLINYFTWKKKRSYKECVGVANLLKENAEVAFSKERYWISGWCYKKSIDCYKEVHREGIKPVLDSILEKVYSTDFKKNHRLDLIGLVIKNLENLNDAEKQTLLSYLMKTSEDYYESSINKGSEEYISGLVFQQRALGAALGVAQRLNKTDLVKGIHLKLGASYETEGDLKDNPLVSTVHYGDAVREYNKAGDKKAQKRIKEKIEKHNSQIQWTKIESSPIELDFSRFDEGVKDLLRRKPQKMLDEIASAGMFIPNLDSAEKTAKEIAKNSPFMFSVPHTHIRDGLSVKKETNEKEILKSKIEAQFMLEAQIHAVYLQRLMDKLIETDTIKPKDIQNFFEIHGAGKALSVLISSAFERHIAKDYISSIKIMASEIETLLRQKLKSERVVTTKPITSDFGLQEATLGTMLKDELRSQTVKLLGENMTEYLRLFLIEKTKGNIRNRVIHGLMQPQEYNKETSTRLLQLLLCIAKTRTS